MQRLLVHWLWFKIASFDFTMSSHNNTVPKTTATTFSGAGTPTDFLLSLAVCPLLLGTLATDAIVSWLQATGISSEEVFRGQRLPVLHFPESERQE